jgi:FkbM family methyltransferase
MKLMDVLCPPVADIGRIRATSYWLKEEVKVLGRRIERLHGQLGHARSVEEVFLQLAGRYPQIMEELRDGALCVDCGAHVGHVSEVLLRLGSRVEAFEPHPVLGHYLRMRLWEFVRDGRLAVHLAAVGSSSGEVDLHILEPLEKTNLRGGLSESGTVCAEKVAAQRTQAEQTPPSDKPADRAQDDAASTPQPVRVRQVDLADFLQRLGRPVTLLKLDIEGAEYEVLESLIACGAHELCRHILVETHHQKVPSLAPRAAALEKLLQEREVKNVYLDWV